MAGLRIGSGLSAFVNICQRPAVRVRDLSSPSYYEACTDCAPAVAVAVDVPDEVRGWLKSEPNGVARMIRWISDSPPQ